MGDFWSKFTGVETTVQDLVPSRKSDQADAMAGPNNPSYNFMSVFEQRKGQMESLFEFMKQDYAMAQHLGCNQSLLERKEELERRILQLEARRQALQREVSDLEKRKEDLVSQPRSKQQPPQRTYKAASQSGNTHGTFSGGLTHDDLPQQYRSFFKTEEWRLQEKLGETAQYAEKCLFLPKQAFELCYEKFQTMIQEAFKEKIASLFLFPDDPMKNPVVDKPTRNLWKAYESLLQCTLMEKEKFVDTVVPELSNTFCTSEDEACPVITEMVTKACELAWDIGSLVPPPVIGFPSDYNERFHEYRSKPHKPPCTLQYYRPVLLHGSHGLLAVNGLVSTKSATKPIHKERPDDAQGTQQQDTPFCRACSKPVLESEQSAKIKGAVFHDHHTRCFKCGKVPKDFSSVTICSDDTMICSKRCTPKESTSAGRNRHTNSQKGASVDEPVSCSKCQLKGIPLKNSKIYNISVCDNCFEMKMICHSCRAEFVPGDEKVRHAGFHWHEECSKRCQFCKEEIAGKVYYTYGQVHGICFECYIKPS